MQMVFPDHLTPPPIHVSWKETHGSELMRKGQNGVLRPLPPGWLQVPQQGGGRWLLSLPGSNIISPPLVLIHHIGTLGTEPEWIYGLLLFTVGVQEETGARSPGFLSGGPVWIRGAGRISRHHPRTNDLIMRRRRWILIIV